MTIAVPSFQYVGSDKYSSVSAWAALTVYTVGTLVRQLTTPTVGNERVFVCTSAGTSSSTEPTWSVSLRALNTNNGANLIECTGFPAMNGDATNTLGWTASAKGNAVSRGQIIKRDNGASYQICTTAGTAGSGAEPSFSNTAGITTSDNTCTWTSLGVVGNFAAFGAPHARINNADSWQVNAGTITYVSNGHAETQTTTLSLSGGAGTTALPSKYFCVSNASAPPTAPTTGATVNTTGATPIAINASSKLSYYYGINFKAGDSTNNGNLILQNTTGGQGSLYFENCGFTLNNSNSSSRIYYGATTGFGTMYGQIVAKNCDFVFGSTSQYFALQNNVNASLKIIGGTYAATGSVPATAFGIGGAGATGNIYVRGLDISAVTGTLVGTGNVWNSQIRFENCKLGSGVAMTGAGLSEDAFFGIFNCDSGSKNYRFYYSGFLGTVQQETTIYNNAGATDGTTHISWNMASGANTQFALPFVLEYLPIVEWQEATGNAVTATVEIAGAATLTNADIWMEIEYLGNASFPIASLANCAAASVFATPANVTSSSASWSGSPAVTQKLQVTFTPQMKGAIRARIMLAKPSTTVYVDPLVTVA